MPGAVAPLDLLRNFTIRLVGRSAYFVETFGVWADRGQLLGLRKYSKRTALSTFCHEEWPNQEWSRVEELNRVEHQSIGLDSFAYAELLQACCKYKALPNGKRVHAHIIKNGVQLDIFLANHFISVYGKCGSIEDARRMFNTLHQRNVVSWNAMITVYAQDGHVEEVFKLFQQMQLEGCEPNRVTFISTLNVCATPAALAEGRSIHGSLVARGFKTNVVVGTALVRMYGKCGSVHDAKKLFGKMEDRNLISWNTMIGVYTQYGFNREALQVFQQMQLEGTKPNKITFITVLNACVNSEALAEGRLIHAHICESGLESNVGLGNTILNAYAKCGSLGDAQRVFDRINDRNNLISWNGLITAYAHHGHVYDTLKVFKQMQLEGVRPDHISIICILSACVDLVALADGKRIHVQVMEGIAEADACVGNALLSMYGKCGDVEGARKTFEKMDHQNDVSWSAMIAVYAQHELRNDALRLFQEMQTKGLKPNQFTFVSALCAITSSAALREGRMIHACIVEHGLEFDIVGNAIISMYDKCGSPEDAFKVFNRVHQWNVESWNAMIAVYCQCGCRKEALQLLEKMEIHDLRPNKITFITALKACNNPAALMEGMILHASIVVDGLELDDVVGSAILNMYNNCSSLDDARHMFYKMLQPNLIPWNSIITAYAQHGHGEDALQLFSQMLQAGVNPDNITFVSIFAACATPATLAEGKLIHAHALKTGYGSDNSVVSALVNMYGKCGTVEDAHNMFHKLEQQDIIAWTALIVAYAQHGHGKKALQLFQLMHKEGVKSDEVSFLSILSACSHSGLVEDGSYYFISMIKDHGITPTPGHYGCIIDLFGRAGLLEDAENLINEMPIQPHILEWMTLLSACREHSDVVRGTCSAEHVLELDSQHCGLCHPFQCL